MKELTPYQKSFVEKGKEMLLREHILFMVLETRVGKTPISLKIAEAVTKDILFVTNLAFTKDVLKEAEEFGVINANIQVSTNHNLTIDKFSYLKGRVIIVDECHEFGGIDRQKKNGNRIFPSSRSEALRRVAGDNMIIFMSATPTPEGFAMIYHIFWISQFSPFSQYKNMYAFHKVYGKPNTKLVNERDRGCGVLLISLELDEVMDLPDRILVIHEGSIVGELDPKKTTFQELGLYMSGAKIDSKFASPTNEGEIK